MSVFYPSYARCYINKKLSIGYIPNAGRNFTGRLCVRHQGGGKKRKFTLIDFYRRVNSIGWLIKILKTTFRSGFMGMLLYTNGFSNYILLSNDVELGQKLYSGSLINDEISVNIGTAVPLQYIPLFSIISCVELTPFSGISLARAAGASAMTTAKQTKFTFIKLTNGSIIKIFNECIVVLGCVSNPKHKYFNYKKAGYKRALGIRPTVRGVAMNPHDHPHGGGEGRKSPPVAARSPWGWLTKGTKTVKGTRLGRHKKKLERFK